MTTPLRVTGPGQPILGYDDWYEAAKPKKGQDHWKAHSSAMEVARAWCPNGGPPAPPPAMLAALDTHDLTRGFVAHDVVVECVTLLDHVSPRREHRNHDLVVLGESTAGRVLVAVEAKAGEPFGDASTANYWKARWSAPTSGGRRSQVPYRIAYLIAALTGDHLDPDATTVLDHPLAGRGYQLLTASVGAVIEAQRRGCPTAVLLVHELRSDPPTAKQKRGLPRAHDDLDAFVATLSNKTYPGAPLGSVVGPFPTHQTPFVRGSVALLVGACRTTVAPHESPEPSQAV